MLQQRNDRDRITWAQDRFQRQLQKTCLRRRRQRRTCGIVRLDAEAGKLGRHPSAKSAIRRDEGGLRWAILTGLFKRQPERDGDCGCLLALIGRLYHRGGGKGAFEEGRGLVRAPFIPFRGRPNRRKCGGKNRGPVLQIAIKFTDPLYIVTQDAELLQQGEKPVLRMGAACRVIRCLIDRLPLIFRHVEVETGKHDGAVRQRGDGSNQIGGSRNGASGACNDDRIRARDLRQPVRLCAKDGVAVAAGGRPVEFGKAGGPINTGDLQKLRGQLPPLRMIGRIQFGERLPILVFRIHRIDDFGEGTRKPDRIRRAGRCHER